MNLEERYGVKVDQLIYENGLCSEKDVEGFVLEGSAKVSFPGGRMRLENAMDENLGQKSNYVFWCPEVFPDNIMIEWEFQPIREPGLCILFYAATGQNGKDLFDPSLQRRTGEYDQYHHGDINAFHVSYFRRKWEEERSFHTCNLRKSYGFHLVTQGADPIPDADEVKRPYKMTVIKKGALNLFFCDELEIFRFEDDGKTYGPFLGGGRIGFRQMAPLIGEYGNLKVYSLL